MPNVILTPSIFAKLVLMHLGDPGGLKVTRNMSADYTKEFGKKGAKIGDTLSVRKPQRFTVTPAMAYAPQPITNLRTAVKVDKWAQVAYEYDSSEKTLSLEDIQERYTKPAAIAIANQINTEAAKYISQNTFNAVGAPGTIPTSMATYLEAEDRLIELGMGHNEQLHLVVNRRMSSAYVDANKALFNDPRTISEQMQKGRMVNSLGYLLDIDQTIYTHTCGLFNGTQLINGTQTATASGNNDTCTINLKGFTASTGTIKAGDVFTVAGVYAVHPQTRVSTGRLQQFVVLQDATADGSGYIAALVAPGLTASGQYQNISAMPAGNAEVLFWSGVTGTPNVSASKVTPQGLLLHRNAFCFLCPPIDNPEPGMGALVAQETDPDTGMSLSVLRAFDSVRRIEVNRADVLYGFGVLYRELACRVAA